MIAEHGISQALSSTFEYAAALITTALVVDHDSHIDSTLLLTTAQYIFRTRAERYYDLKGQERDKARDEE